MCRLVTVTIHSVISAESVNMNHVNHSLLNSNQCFEPVCSNEGTITMNERENATEWRNRTNGCYEYQCHNATGGISWKRENATIWESQSNACYLYECHNVSGLIYWKRENATIWEDKSNGCYEFKCHNESGPIYWKQCNSTDKIERVCENNQCINKEEMMFFVEIDVEGIHLSNLNMTEIQHTISNLTDIEADKLRIRVDINEQDEVNVILIIVDDRYSAEKITKLINDNNCNNSKSSRKKQI